MYRHEAMNISKVIGVHVLQAVLQASKQPSVCVFINEICCHLWENWFYEVTFSLTHTGHSLGDVDGR